MPSRESREMNRVSCPLCRSEAAVLWGEEDGFTMVRCLECGLVYLNPRPAPEEIDDAVRTGMHKTREGMANFVGRYSGRKVREFKRKLHDLGIPDIEASGRNMRWLDIGAGYGELLRALNDLLPTGSTVLGIEPCEPKVRVARKRKLPVENVKLEEVKGTFTHVSLMNVLSHLPDPLEFFKALKSRMTDPARLLVVTGNGAEISREEFPGPLYLPDHLLFVGESQIRRMLEMAGFNVILINRYRRERDSFPIGLLKNLIRKISGRKTVPLVEPAQTAYRSLWIYAEVRRK